MNRKNRWEKERDIVVCGRGKGKEDGRWTEVRETRGKIRSRK